MTLLLNNLENGLANGTDLTASNSASPNNFTSVVKTQGNASVKVSTTSFAHGSRGLQLRTGVTPGQAYVQWNLTAGDNQEFNRLVVKINAAPTSNFRLLQFGNSAGSCMDLELRTDMRLRVRNAYSALQFQTEPLPLNTWIRIESFCKFIEGTGSSQLRVFDAADSINTLAYYDSSNDGTFRGIPTYVRAGIATDTANASIDFDDIGVASDAYLGPVVAPNYPPVVSAGLYKPVAFGKTAVVTTTATDPEGGAVSYAYSTAQKPAGSVVAITGSGTSRTIACDKPGKVVIACTVTDPQGAVTTVYHVVEFVNRWWIGPDMKPVSFGVHLTTTPVPTDPYTLVFEDNFDTLVGEGSMFNTAGNGQGAYAAKWKAYPPGYLTTWGQGKVNGVTIGDHYATSTLSVVSGVAGAGGNVMQGRLIIGPDGKRWGVAPIPMIGATGTNGIRTYGRVEYRFRIDATPGWHPAHLWWNTRNYLPQSDPNYLPWPYAGETDFLEGITGGNAGVFMHHYMATSQAQQDHFTSTAPMSTWHVYKHEWTPGSWKFWVDGVLLRINGNGADGSYGTKVCPDPMQLIFQTENDNSASNQPAAGTTCMAQWDYVKYWTYTP